MSVDPEDSLLEALRSDLPSTESAARVRRRLVAAGVAVGNGMAVTTAAAAGASPGLVSGVVAKVAALSWGIKVGALAVVAIPTVGLLVDRATSEPVPHAAPAAPRQAAGRAIQGALEAQHDATRRAPEVAREAPMPPTALERNQLGPAPVVANHDDQVALPSRPSQVEFAASDPAAAPKATSTLAEETRLLDGAFGELAAGHSERAAALIGEHERRFPTGLLTKERERARARLTEISRGE